MNQKEKIRQRIIGILSKSLESISKREILRLLKISPATTSKYVDILRAERKAELRDYYGNINVVTLKR